MRAPYQSLQVKAGQLFVWLTKFQHSHILSFSIILSLTH